MTLGLFVATCGIISTVLAIYSGIPYLRSVIKGRTKPHQFSWLIFAIMNGIVTISQFLEGGRTSVLISLTFFIYCVITFVLSLSRGSRDTSRFDRFLFGFSLLTIAVWVLTQNNAAAIWLTVVIDICATTMIMLKIFADPHSEDPFPWAIGAVAYIFSCLALLSTQPGVLYVRPFYGLLTDALIAGSIYYLLFVRRKKRRAQAAISDDAPPSL